MQLREERLAHRIPPDSLLFILPLKV